MKWAFRIADFAGIRVQVHSTFLLLLIWIALSYWQLTGSMASVVSGVLFILALFTCVVLHEFGHALTARQFGIRTRSITLLPIGGVAAIERTPNDPRQEILIALAGPAVSLAIALLLWLALQLSGSGVPAEELDAVRGPFLQRLMVVNLLLALFNMVPAFPMDGGRVFRALLSLVLAPVTATRVAAGIGQLIALGFALLGLMYNPFLFLIAVFIWIGATVESGSAQLRHALHDVTAGQAMMTDFRVLSPDDSLVEAIELTLAGSQKDFPVVKQGKTVGVLSQANLLEGLHRVGQECPVARVMQTSFLDVSPRMHMSAVLDQLQTQPGSLTTVSRDGELQGIITLDNIMELLSIQTAIHTRLPAGAPQ